MSAVDRRSMLIRIGIAAASCYAHENDPDFDQDQYLTIAERVNSPLRKPEFSWTGLPGE
jgi:hypothetical protein